MGLDCNNIRQILYKSPAARKNGVIDKNHGGILIIWDRMFGTFASEFSKPEKIQYG